MDITREHNELIALYIMPQYIVYYACHKDHETEVIRYTNEAHLRRDLIREILQYQDEDDKDSDVKFVADPLSLTTTELIHNALYWGRMHAAYSHDWLNIVHIIAIGDRGKVTFHGPTTNVYK